MWYNRLDKKKRGEFMRQEDSWFEMSYNKYRNPKNLHERLAMEELDVFDINCYMKDCEEDIETEPNND